MFERQPSLGGQLLVAKAIPGKEEFNETIRYFTHELEQAGVEVLTGVEVDSERLASFGEVVVATGVKPRAWNVPGADRSEVVGYLDVLEGRVEVGRRVAVIGAGGIGFDVTDFLTHDADAAGFLASWGVDATLENRGGLAESRRKASHREVTMYQRGQGKMGANLGKSTGWIHRNTLRARGVKQETGVQYVKVDDEGLHVILSDGTNRVHPVDHVVVCAGQESRVPQGLSHPNMTVVGGAHNARSLDAQRAIREGLLTAFRLRSDTA